ncbi:MAG: serine hydrolase domain-containing protein [Pseudomonadota bacterium]
MRSFLFVLAIISGICACASDEPVWRVQTDLEALQSQHANVPGFAIAMISEDTTKVAATGQADPDGTPMSAATPVRIASITKTFVAASILRLWEDGLLDLDASIDGLVNPEIDALLRNDGYNTENITVRHLLMHASGMADHVGDAYVEQVFRDPRRVWTPTEQIEVLITTADPLSEPGVQFAYSDTGYVLLGEILREVTDAPLHQAVRELLKLDRLELRTLHWDELELPQGDVPSRAHQWMDGIDIFAMHGSMDGHGGGGLVASVEDVAIFYKALFNNEIFADPTTLELMTTAPDHPIGSPYRYGLFALDVAGLDAFHHGGFWGIYVTHVPGMDLTIAGVALDQSGYEDVRKLMSQAIEQHIAE